MKLSLPKLSFNEKLDEFDFWITPSLGEIKNSPRYSEVQDQVCSLIEIIGRSTDEFSSYGTFSAATIAASVSDYISHISSAEKTAIVNSLAAFLFLVTGKSDNNSKCQFPLFLRDIARVSTFPKILRAKSIASLSETEIPREIKSDRIARLVSELDSFRSKQLEILTQYVSFIIDSEHYLKSFWTIGKTYFEMKKVGFEKDFLQPLITFQVRGSVSASGGHEPEDNLRQRMLEWGLTANIDFNNSDIIIDSHTTVKETSVEIPVSETDTVETIIEKVEEVVKHKTRAYDFVLPYRVSGWDQRLFIQCQFYAGDSGSVSHKNVDQTRTSRNFVKTKRKDPIFIEYIDGAGYFSSLWGDLKKIISMDDTTDFFQVRTAVLKLRHNLQEIGFLTPLEVAHACAVMKGNLADIKSYLIKAGYSDTEVERVLENKLFSKANDALEVEKDFLELSRKYLLLDFIALKGQKFDDYTRITGVLLVPAYGKYYGIKLDDIISLIIPESGSFSSIWSNSAELLKDIQFLANNGWIVQR